MIRRRCFAPLRKSLLRLGRLGRCASGATVIEYALLLAMLSVGALAAYETLAGHIDVFYDALGTKIESKNAK